MPHRDVLTLQGEQRLPYASRLLGLGVLLAILGVFALAGCYISRTIDQATASDVNNRNFTFTNGAVFHSVLTNVSTALAFPNNDNAQTFTLCSGSNTATGTNRFGSCTLTVTGSSYTSGNGPQVGITIPLTPCTFDNNMLTVSNLNLKVTSGSCILQ